MNMSANMMNTGFSTGEVMIEVISCQQVVIGSEGSVNVDYTKGGRAAILIPEQYLRGTPLCKVVQDASYQASTIETTSSSGAIPSFLRQPSTPLSVVLAVVMGALLGLCLV